MKFSLQHPYPGVGREGAHSYGGNQRWLRDKAMQHCGCGVVAALDLVRYLHLYRDGFSTDFFVGVDDVSAVSRPLYDLCTQRMEAHCQLSANTTCAQYQDRLTHQGVRNFLYNESQRTFGGQCRIFQSQCFNGEEINQAEAMPGA